jgi:hypothetical protein
MIVVITMTYLTIGVLGICIGIIVERAEWNKLIQDGIIPKPVRRRKDG